MFSTSWSSIHYKVTTFKLDGIIGNTEIECLKLGTWLFYKMKKFLNCTLKTKFSEGIILGHVAFHSLYKKIL